MEPPKLLSLPTLTHPLDSTSPWTPRPVARRLMALWGTQALTLRTLILPSVAPLEWTLALRSILVPRLHWVCLHQHFGITFRLSPFQSRSSTRMPTFKSSRRLSPSLRSVFKLTISTHLTSSFCRRSLGTRPASVQFSRLVMDGSLGERWSVPVPEREPPRTASSMPFPQAPNKMAFQGLKAAVRVRYLQLTCYGSRRPTDAPRARAWAHDHPRTFDPLYSYRNLLVTTPVTFFINTCRDRVARPADFMCRGALAYGNIPQSIFHYVSRSIIG
jgi:hypothetical protein